MKYFFHPSFIRIITENEQYDSGCQKQFSSQFEILQAQGGTQDKAICDKTQNQVDVDCVQNEPKSKRTVARRLSNIWTVGIGPTNVEIEGAV